MTRAFNPNPGPTILRWGWLLWLAWTAVGVGLLLEDLRHDRAAIAAVLTAPLWGAWLLWPCYRGWAAWHRQRHSRWSRRQGNYYEFDGQPIRVVFDGDRIWFAADDVFDALGLTGRLRDPERGRLIAGREGLTTLPESKLLVFSETGLAAWLERRTDADALKLARWVRVQVVEPYRRKRELDTS